MLTLCTLLPSDNKAILGRFEGFYDALLTPSDNKPIHLGRFYALHYIECASFIILLYIISYDNIPYDSISQYIIPCDNI